MHTGFRQKWKTFKTQEFNKYQFFSWHSLAKFLLKTLGFNTFAANVLVTEKSGN